MPGGRRREIVGLTGNRPVHDAVPAPCTAMAFSGPGNPGKRRIHTGVRGEERRTFNHPRKDTRRMVEIMRQERKRLDLTDYNLHASATGVCRNSHGRDATTTRLPATVAIPRKR